MTASTFYNSSTDKLTVTDTSVLQNIFNGGGTISAWVYRSSTSGSDGIISKASGASFPISGGWQCWMPGGLTGIYFYQVFSTTNGYWTTTPGYSLNSWFYIAVTYDSSSSSNVPQRSINGGSFSNFGVTSTPSGTYSSDVGNNMILGNSSYSIGHNGYLCHLQAWTKVLSQAEAMESMAKPGTVRSSLVGYWPCMGQDSPERDLSGNGNTATISGTTGGTLGPKITMSR